MTTPEPTPFPAQFPAGQPGAFPAPEKRKGGKGKWIALGVIAVAIGGFASTQGKNSERCVSAAGAPSRIATGLTNGATLTGKSSAVKSGDFAKVYMVAAELSIPGASNQTAVWATNDLDGGLIYAVDGMAKQFSSWGDGSKTDAAITVTADGVDEAKGCI